MPNNLTPGAAPTTASVPTEGAKQGLLSRIFENNQGKWLIGLGIVTLIVTVIYLRRQSSTSTATDTGSVASTTPTSPDQMFGAQLETDYQQMIANQNTTTGLLQAIQNQLSNTSSNTTAPVVTPPPGQGFLQPLVPAGVSIPNKFGQFFDYEGIHYEVGPGGIGADKVQRLWGVRVQPGQHLSLSQWNQVPIGPGGKVLLRA